MNKRTEAYKRHRLNKRQRQRRRQQQQRDHSDIDTETTITDSETDETFTTINTLCCDCECDISNYISDSELCYIDYNINYDCNCPHSSSSIAIVLNSSRLVSPPHEWESDGGDEREVIPPLKGPPLAKLLAARPPEISADPGRHYCVRGRPERFVASEHDGTEWPGCYIQSRPAPPSGPVYHHQDKWIVKPRPDGELRLYRRDGRTRPIGIAGQWRIRASHTPRGAGGVAVPAATHL